MCVVGIIVVLFAFRRGVRLLASVPNTTHHLRWCYSRVRMKQSGAGRFAFVALLLLALPEALTFQALYALPRFAERNRTF